MKTQAAMTSEHSKLSLLGLKHTHPKPCPLPISPVVVKIPPALNAMVKPFINSILSCNYTVRQPEHSIFAPQCSLLAAVHFEGNQKEWKSHSFHKHFSCYDRKGMRAWYLICPLQGYPGRSPGSTLPGGNESCWHHRRQRQANHLRVQGIEAASLSALKKPRSQVHEVAPSQTE